MKTAYGTVMITFIVNNDSNKAIQLGIWAVESKSTRTVAINIADPETRPPIVSEIKVSPDDVKAITLATKKILKVFSDPSLSPYFGKPNIKEEILREDAKLEKYIESKLQGNNHYSHSVPLGIAVDEDTFLLKNTTNVRVADLSVVRVCDGPTAAAAAAIGLYAGTRIIKSYKTAPTSTVPADPNNHIEEHANNTDFN